MACRPYYQRGDVTLYHCRHEDLAVMLQAESVDAIVTDPPYAETSLEWDVWPKGWPALVRPFLKRTGSMWCFGSFRMWWDKRDEFTAGGWQVAEDVVWKKQNGSGFATDRFRRVHEQPVHFYRADSPWKDVFHEVPVTMDAKARKVTRRAANGSSAGQHLGRTGASSYETVDGGPRLMTSVLEVRNCHGYAINETQKPVELVEPLVRNACPRGGLVLDFFAGSGSTALACLRTGRRFIGCDIREQQLELAARAISEGGPLTPETRRRAKTLPLNFGT